MSKKKELSLYFHIPFCESRCFYCDFYSNTNNSETLKSRYTNALKNSLKVPIDCDDYNIKTIYFGGGTPTLLGANHIAEILQSINNVFQVSSDCEITVESNPNSVCVDELKLLKSVGVNRLSFGVQSLNDELLLTIGRTHSAKTALETIENASKVGFDNISVDMMFGLPEQQPTVLYEDLQKLLKFNNLKHISLYNLRLEEGTKLYNKRNMYAFLDDDAEADMYFEACKLLNENGFLHYEISNFAKKGYESQHNLNYWRCGDFLGYGASAHSRFNNRLFNCDADINDYILKTESSGNLFSISNYANASEMCKDEQDEVYILMSLRTSEGLDLKKLHNPDIFIGKAARFIKSKLLRQTKKGYRLSEEAFFISNTIIAALI